MNPTITQRGLTAALSALALDLPTSLLDALPERIELEPATDAQIAAAILAAHGNLSDKKVQALAASKIATSIGVQSALDAAHETGVREAYREHGGDLFALLADESEKCSATIRDAAGQGVEYGKPDDAIRRGLADAYRAVEDALRRLDKLAQAATAAHQLAAGASPSGADRLVWLCPDLTIGQRATIDARTTFWDIIAEHRLTIRMASPTELRERRNALAQNRRTQRVADEREVLDAVLGGVNRRTVTS